MEKTVFAGKKEKGDTFITLSSHAGPNEIHITSPVFDLFGHHIRSAVEQTLEEQQVTNVLVHVEDNQALDCVTQARLKCAIGRLRKGEGV